MHKSTLLAALFSLGAPWACSPVPGPAKLPQVDGVHGTVRARVSLIFEEIDMYKPRIEEGADLDPYLAPIIYREVVPGQQEEAPLGALVTEEDGLSVDGSMLTVYYREGVASVDGVEYRQLSFNWFVPGAGADTLDSQGLRVTFDTAGLPAIFEVLEDRSGVSQFYVTAPLEALAIEEHGAPLAGRHLSVEPDLEEWPDVIVPRTVGQSPVALGPIAYLRGSSRDVHNLHCRCDPSLITSIRATLEYELVLLERMPDGARDFAAPDWPFRCLRLPSAF
jgi:hypothetical protein